MQDTLLTWSGETMAYHDYIVQSWTTGPLAGSADPMTAFNKALQIGLYQPEGGSISAAVDSAVAALTATTEMAPVADMSGAASAILAMAKKLPVLRFSFMNQ